MQPTRHRTSPCNVADSLLGSGVMRGSRHFRAFWLHLRLQSYSLGNFFFRKGKQLYNNFWYVNVHYLKTIVGTKIMLPIYYFFRLSLNLSRSRGSRDSRSGAGAGAATKRSGSATLSPMGVRIWQLVWLYSKMLLTLLPPMMVHICPPLPPPPPKGHVSQ